MADNPVEKKSRCRFLGFVFNRRGLWSKKCPADNGSHKSTMSSSNASTATATTANIQFTKSPCTEFNPRKLQENKVLPEPIEVQNQVQRPVSKPSSHQYPNNNQLGSNGNNQPSNNNQGPVQQQQARKVPREAIGLSGELESMIIDNQKAKGNNGSMVRPSSSNVMLFGNLGNLKQPGPSGGNQTTIQNNGYGNTGGGYGVKKTLEEERKTSVAQIPASNNQDQSGSLCRAISTRMDPETLKIMGNEDYKNGNFAEALALYEAAISIDPKKASYRSNKSAALTALGRILEAVFECREAIRIDPHYHRAHHRLANLYLRLGEVENSIYHFKHAGPEADQEDISKAKMVQTHLNKCTEAKRLRDWNTLIKETENTITTGADAAPQVYALQAEAFLKTYRHQEADDALSRCPVFDGEMSTKYYGPIGYAGFLVVWAQVHMASGRFVEAVEAIQRAGKLDGNNREVSMVLRRAQAVTAARSRGNDFFKAGRFQEACTAYGEGLDHDSRNSVLLCNRAACLSKMGQFDRAVEDTSAALAVRPGYTKARLRRADCNAKLGNWESAVGDYEILRKETPEDEEVIKGLSEAQKQLVKRRGHDS
ncbi:putative tetratricopeptide-like helical domain superfamily [Arabidopsis thaliana]